MFETYTNWHNPHVTIHRDGCDQIRKRGGEHKHNQGEYQNHTTLGAGDYRGGPSGLAVINCSFCKPSAQNRTSS